MAKLSQLQHENYYNSKYELIPSVTTVLKLLNKPELVEWANWMGRMGKDSTQFTKESAEVGTYAHYIIERLCKKKIIHLKGMYEDLSSKQISKVYSAVKGFKKWNKDHKPKFIHNELKLKNEYYGGTIDCICEIDNHTYMIDFKTSKKIYPTYFLQLAGYNYLYKKEYGESLDYAGILMLDKSKGTYTFQYTDIESIEKSYEPVFIELLNLYYMWRGVLKNDWCTEL